MGLSIRPKTLKGQLRLVFILIGTIFLALASIVLYRNGESALRRRLITAAESAAETAASLIGVQDHRSIRGAEDMNSTAFREIVTNLSALRRANPSITHLFTLSPVGQLGSWGVIVDMGGAAPERGGAELVRGRLPIGSPPPPNVPPDLIREAMSLTASRIIDLPSPDRARVVAISPIRGSEGVSTGLAVVELSAADLIEETQALLLLSLAIFFVGLVVSILASTLASRWVTRPVEDLLRAVDEIAKGNLHARVLTRARNELGALGSAFNQMAQSLEVSQARSLEHQQRLRDLHQLGSQVASTLELSDTLKIAAVGMRAICGGAEVVAGARDSRAKSIRVWIRLGGEATDTPEWNAETAPLEGVLGGETRLLSRAELEVAGLGCLPNRPEEWALAAPLRASDRTIGVLVALGERARFHDDAVSLASLLGAQVSAAVGNAHLFEQVRALDRSKSEFLSIASHEVRTPLTVMKSSLDILVDNPKFAYSDDQRQLIAFCQESVERLIRLVKDILDVSKIEAGVLSVQFLPTSLNELIEKCLFWVPQLPGGHGIEVDARLPAEPAMVLADGGRITQVLENLISNAIKFSQPGGKVTIELKEHEREFEVIVRDQGKGIAQEHLKRVFGKFYQVADSATREQGGTGLGLAICKGIIEAHRGRIWAESAPGQGSSFHFALARVMVSGPGGRADAQIPVSSLLSPLRSGPPMPAAAPPPRPPAPRSAPASGRELTADAGTP
ncbi:MAG TPA: ATP-binding protein [Candidatus Eisenbacteria bacterium]|jgi:signal transduction histidine kinase